MNKLTRERSPNTNMITVLYLFTLTAIKTERSKPAYEDPWSTHLFWRQCVGVPIHYLIDKDTERDHSKVSHVLLNDWHRHSDFCVSAWEWKRRFSSRWPNGEEGLLLNLHIQLTTSILLIWDQSGQRFCWEPSFYSSNYHTALPQYDHCSPTQHDRTILQAMAVSKPNIHTF